MYKILMAIVSIFISFNAYATAESRIKDIADIEGVRDSSST